MEAITFFDELQFDEIKHTYTLKNKKYISVSKKIEEFYKPFDPSIAKYVAIAKNTTELAIKSEWEKLKKQSIVKGNILHKYAHEKLSGKDVKPFNSSQRAIDEYINNITDEIVFVEKPIFSIKYGYAGTPDLVLYNLESGLFRIVDWKTNKDINKNYKGQKMLTPFEDLLDTPLNHYAVQLSLYQICLEEAGLAVESRTVIHFQDEGFTPYELPDLTSSLITHYDSKSSNRNVERSN